MCFKHEHLSGTAVMCSFRPPARLCKSDHRPGTFPCWEIKTPPRRCWAYHSVRGYLSLLQMCVCYFVRLKHVRIYYPQACHKLSVLQTLQGRSCYHSPAVAAGLCAVCTATLPRLAPEWICCPWMEGSKHLLQMAGYFSTQLATSKCCTTWAWHTYCPFSATLNHFPELQLAIFEPWPHSLAIQWTGK